MFDYLSGLDERRKLRHNLGPAYRPLMGTPMGHYELDMAKPTHRMAARKVRGTQNKVVLRRFKRPFSRHVWHTGRDGVVAMPGAQYF